MSDDFIEVRTKIRRRRVLKTSYNQSPGDRSVKIPAIRFSGSYLEDLGFAIGGNYEMVVNPDNTITLRALPENGSSKETSEA